MLDMMLQSGSALKVLMVLKPLTQTEDVENVQS